MKPSPSELAACAWIAGGALATVVLQAITEGQHSVSRGLREHPAATVLLGVTFAFHLAKWPKCLARFDPFSLLAPPARLTRGKHGITR
jgi:hypothetical protein